MSHFLDILALAWERRSALPTQKYPSFKVQIEQCIILKMQDNLNLSINHTIGVKFLEYLAYAHKINKL